MKFGVEALIYVYTTIEIFHVYIIIYMFNILTFAFWRVVTVTCWLCLSGFWLVGSVSCVWERGCISQQLTTSCSTGREAATVFGIWANKLWTSYSFKMWHDQVLCTIRSFCSDMFSVTTSTSVPALRIISHFTAGTDTVVLSENTNGSCLFNIIK